MSIDFKNIHDELKTIKKEVDEETADDLANLMTKLSLEEKQEEPSIIDLSSFKE